jgi:cold-inducible RNA-binding protein
MAKKLYVGNLPFSFSDSNQLKAIFEECGPVSDATIIMDKMTNRPRGFGFVTMEDAAADEAVQKMNGKDVEGRKITVNEARPMAERRPARKSY